MSIEVSAVRDLADQIEKATEPTIDLARSTVDVLKVISGYLASTELLTDERLAREVVNRLVLDKDPDTGTMLRCDPKAKRDKCWPQQYRFNFYKPLGISQQGFGATPALAMTSGLLRYLLLGCLS